MQLPVNITYRGVEKSEQLDNLVMSYAARLDRFCDHINRCDVAIEQTNHTHQKGNPYRCRIDVTVRPRHELVSDEKQMDNGGGSCWPGGQSDLLRENGQHAAWQRRSGHR